MAQLSHRANKFTEETLHHHQERVRDLEAEVRRLKMEKDILKKATAFFVQEKP